MDAAKGIAEFWQVITGIVLSIVWLTRIEAKVKTLETDLDDLRKKHEFLDGEVMEQLSQLRTSLARIEGRLGIKE